MTQEEAAFYRSFYKVLSDPVINELFVKYAQMKYNNAVSKVRSKIDNYDHGYNNGSADAWQSVINLKQSITEIMKNIG